MDDTNLYYKQQSYLNTCSDADDSTSFPSFPWFPGNNRRRKSRLGTHHNQIRRVIQEAPSNDGDHSSSNKENIYDRLPSSPPDPAPETHTELKPSDDMETSPVSCTKSKFHNQTSPLLSIHEVFDDGVSPLVTSFEKSRTMATSFPSYLSEDEIDNILREINSPDNIATPRFPRSPNITSVLNKSFDASVNSVITNLCQNAETKMNQWFSGKLSNVSSLPAVEDLGLASSQETSGSAAGSSDSMNSIIRRNSSVRSSYSANTMELLANSGNSGSQPETESSGFHEMNNSIHLNSNISTGGTGLPNKSSMPTSENCSDSSNSVERTSDSLRTRSKFSEPLHPRLPIDLSSMQDQENANFRSPETNSKFPIDLSSMHDQENYFDFQNPTINPELPIDLSPMQDQDNFVESQNSNEITPSVGRSSIQGLSVANFQNPAESSSNLRSKEITNDVDGVQSSTELKSMSISSLTEAPSTVKSQIASIPISDDDKIAGSSAIALAEPRIPPPDPVVPPEAPKPSVQFAEPAVVREFAVPRNSSKIPAAITVKGKVYKVLNILGSGGSSVVFQVSDPETNELLALKRVELPDEDDEITDGYLNEVQMLENLQNCDVIIRIFDHQLVCKNGKKTLHVVMEKGDTDLSSLIKSVNESKKLSIPMIIYYWTEMLAAVNEVHRRGIIHSDLKPANFVLVRGRLKLIDFGIASSMQGDVTSVYKDFFCGTLNYMSPEATSCVQCPSGGAGYKITFKTDVWSLGCILYNLVYGRLPFHHIRKRLEKIHAIVSPTINVEFPEKKDVPPILISLLKSCLEKDYKRRPTVQELLDRTMRIFQCSTVD